MDLRDAENEKKTTYSGRAGMALGAIATQTGRKHYLGSRLN